MAKFAFLPLLLCGLICAALGAEKVLFGEPAPIAAEGRQASEVDAAKDAKAKGGRQARVFQFPGNQQQDSRTYVLSSPYETQDRFIGAAASDGQDENRLLSLLPSLGGDGMQVGLDFKLPFFSIPYAKMFSALSAPSIGGGSFFGAGSSPYGSTADASSLASNLLGSGGGLSSGLATAAAMAVTASLLYPKITGLFSGKEGAGLTFRDGNGADDFFQNLNSVLGQFNIDGEACMKVALCNLGNARRYQKTRARDPSGTTTPGDIVEDLLNLPAVKSLMNKGGLVQARDFGGSGGDCDYFNAQNKCPISSETFNKAVASLG